MQFSPQMPSQAVTAASHLWRVTAKQGCFAVHKQSCIHFLLTVATMVSSLCHAVVPSHQKKGVIPQVIHQGPATRIKKVNSYFVRVQTAQVGEDVLTKPACTTAAKPTKG